MTKRVISADGVTFETSADVLIIGAGACGLTAALAAHDEGADVLVLELLVFGVEWIGYSRLLRVSTGLALRYALFANLVSAGAGIVIWMANMA